MTDPDIVAVRELPPGMTEPTDESLSRTWHAVTRKQAAPRLLRRRWAVPVGAAAVVAGLAAGAALLVPGDAGPGVQVGTAPSTGESPKAGPSGSGPAPGGAPVTTPRNVVPSAPPSGAPVDARTALDRLITAAGGSTATTIGPDRKLYVRIVDTDGPSGDVRRTLRTSEMWLGPDLVSAEGVPATGNPTNKPSILAPTPAWLAALPTDPAALQAELRAGLGVNTKWSDPHLLTKQLSELLITAEPLLTPEVRVAMLRMIKTWSGVTARETTLDGRPIYAIRHMEQGRFHELLFDPTTGRAVGRSSGQDGAVAYTYWTHKIVRAVGER